jgi:head-tail adaptor
VEHLYNSLINIYRITRNSDAYGSWIETETKLHSNLKCRINWKSGREKIWGEKNTYFRDGRLYCGVVDITVKDRIEYSGKKYEVVEVNNVDNLNKFLTIDFKLIE